MRQIRSTVALFMCAIVCSPGAQAQAAQALVPASPSFEVASIKKDTEGVLRMGGPDVSRYWATSVTARMLIAFAYDVKDFQFAGAPGWVDSEKFDVDAKVEDSLAEQLRKLPHVEQQQQLRLMLQSLLADRFALKITHATKEMPIFALVVAKGGTKLTPVAPPDPETSAPFPALPGPGHPTLAPGGAYISLLPGNRATISGKSAPVSALTSMLAALLGRPVDDRTGLEGMYDFLVSYTRDPGLEGSPPPSPNAAPSPPDRSGASLFTALQEQLGLKLETTRGPVDTITIDHIEEPTPN
jgi:uncharacterized protein (TIGR03435 family)